MASLRMVFSAATGQFAKRMASLEMPMARAATAAIAEAAETALIRGRRSIASAPGALGASQKWQMALHKKLYPAQGVSMNPAAVIYSKIPYSEEFEEGETIAGKPILWLPLDNVPMGNGGRRLSPKQFVAQIGALYKFTPRGHRPMLFAVVKETDARAKKAVSLRLLKRGRNPSGKGKVRYVPVYVSIATVTDPKEFNVVAAVQSVQKDLGNLYIKYLEDPIDG